MWDFIKIDTTVSITIAGITSFIIWFGSFLWKRNNSYYNLIKEFRNKLPRPQMSAKPFESNLPFTTINVSTHRTSLTESEIDVFYNSLKYFDYSWVLYKRHYRAHANNLFRFDPKATNKNFDLIMVQQILNDETLYRLKPLDILVYHLKYKHKITSKPYLCFFSKIKKIKL